MNKGRYTWVQEYESGKYLVTDAFYTDWLGLQFYSMRNVAIHTFKVRDRTKFMNRAHCTYLKNKWCAQNGYNPHEYVAHHETDGQTISIVEKNFHARNSHYGGIYLMKMGYI